MKRVSECLYVSTEALDMIIILILQIKMQHDPMARPLDARLGLDESTSHASRCHENCPCLVGNKGLLLTLAAAVISREVRGVRARVVGHRRLACPLSIKRASPALYTLLFLVPGTAALGRSCGERQLFRAQ